MSDFSLGSQSLSGSILVSDFVKSDTALSAGIDNRLPVVLLSNAKTVAALVADCEILLSAKFILTSGYRCAELNLLVGGSVNSFHQQALAVDGFFIGMQSLTACKIIAQSKLGIREVELKQRQLHLACGDRSRLVLLRQFIPRGAVVVVKEFL